jgi:hypothetical protein
MGDSHRGWQSATSDSERRDRGGQYNLARRISTSFVGALAETYDDGRGQSVQSVEEEDSNSGKASFREQDIFR